MWFGIKCTILVDNTSGGTTYVQKNFQTSFMFGGVHDTIIGLITNKATLGVPRSNQIKFFKLDNAGSGYPVSRARMHVLCIRAFRIELEFRSAGF